MKRNNLTNFFIGLSGLAVIIAAWELASRLAGAKALVPPPSTVLNSILENKDLFIENTQATLVVAVLSFILAISAAFLVASAIALSSKANKALSPVVIASQAFPLVTIAPFLVYLFGPGNGFIIFFAAYITWFPAVIPFIHGLTRISPDRLALFQSAGASRWQIYKYLRLPSAVPYLLAGLRAAAALAFINAVVAEYSGATAGIGSIIILNTAGVVEQPPEILVGLALVSAVIGLAIAGIVYGTSKWKLKRYLEA